MVAIFEDRKIESNDTGDKLKFPVDSTWENLPPDCRNLPRGQFARLKVKDDQGDTHWLTIKNQNDEICFTLGWKDFIKGKAKVGDKISLYKEDDNFGSGPPQYTIKVTRA